VAAAIGWAKQNLDFEYLKCQVDEKNISSKKIAESNGRIAEDRYQRENARGGKMNLVEYRIYPTEKETK